MYIQPIPQILASCRSIKSCFQYDIAECTSFHFLCFLCHPCLHSCHRHSASIQYTPPFSRFRCNLPQPFASSTRPVCLPNTPTVSSTVSSIIHQRATRSSHVVTSTLLQVFTLLSPHSTYTSYYPLSPSSMLLGSLSCIRRFFFLFVSEAMFFPLLGCRQNEEVCAYL